MDALDLAMKQMLQFPAERRLIRAHGVVSFARKIRAYRQRLRARTVIEIERQEPETYYLLMAQTLAWYESFLHCRANVRREPHAS